MARNCSSLQRLLQYTCVQNASLLPRRIWMLIKHPIPCNSATNAWWAYNLRRELHLRYHVRSRLHGSRSPVVLRCIPLGCLRRISETANCCYCQAGGCNYHWVFYYLRRTKLIRCLEPSFFLALRHGLMTVLNASKGRKVAQKLVGFLGLPKP